MKISPLSVKSQSRVVVRSSDAVDAFRLNAPEIMNVDGAARFLGVSPRALSDNVDALKIPHKTIGRTLIFSRVALVRWAEDSH